MALGGERLGLGWGGGVGMGREVGRNLEIRAWNILVSSRFEDLVCWRKVGVNGGEFLKTRTLVVVLT